MPRPPVPAAVAEDDRWEHVEDADEELGGTGPVRVRSERALYGDRELRDRVREATGPGRIPGRR